MARAPSTPGYGSANCGHFWVADFNIPNPLPGIGQGVSPRPFEVEGTTGQSPNGFMYANLSSLKTAADCATAKYQTQVYGYANSAWTTLANQTVTAQWNGSYCTMGTTMTASIQPAYAYETYRVAVTLYAYANGVIEYLPVQAIVWSY
jgi:hypothetical protein